MSNDDYEPNSLNATLSRIETKMDTLIEVKVEHEKRITKLEQFRYYLAGGVAVVIGIIKYLGK